MKSLLLDNLEMGIIVGIKHGYGTCYLLVCVSMSYICVELYTYIYAPIHIHIHVHFIDIHIDRVYVRLCGQLLLFSESACDV